MLIPKLGNNVKLEPEQRLCIEFANLMRFYTINNRLKTTWHHVANEGKRSRIVANILKAMGLIPGVADYNFGGYSIEFKVKTPQTDNQKNFEKWKNNKGEKYAVCYSIDEAVSKLREWKILQ